MIKEYLQEVIIWYFILFATIKINAPVIIKNNWAEKNKDVSTIRKYFNILLIALIPFIRLLFVFALFVLALVKNPNKKDE